MIPAFVLLERLPSYYKRNMTSPRNVAQTFPQDYIFERFGELESSTKGQMQSDHLVVVLCRSTFDTPSIDVTCGICVDKRAHLELLRKSRCLDPHINSNLEHDTEYGRIQTYR